MILSGIDSVNMTSSNSVACWNSSKIGIPVKKGSLRDVFAFILTVYNSKMQQQKAFIDFLMFLEYNTPMSFVDLNEVFFTLGLKID